MTAPKLRFKEFDEDWNLSTLANISSIITGSTPSTSNREYYDGEFLFVSPADIQENRYVEKTKTTLTANGFSKCRHIPENSVLFVCIGSTIGKVAQNKVICATNQQINAVIPNKGYSSDFLYVLLEKLAPSIKLNAGVQAVPLINKTEFGKTLLNLPISDEQTKIASFLSAVDEKISQLTQKHELLSQYKQGMMQKLFSQQLRFKADDGGEFGEWEESKIIDVADYVDYRGKTPKKVEDGVLLVTAKNIRFGHIDYEVSKEYICLEDFDEVMRRGRAEVGDVLITTEAPLGNVASVDREDIALAQRVIKYRGKSGILNNEFLKQKFLSEDFQALIFSKATGGTVQGIKGSTLHNLEIHIPQDIEEQTKIANFLSSIDQKIEVAAQQIEQAKTWKKGLLQQMFV